jgi:hypothetical protein
MQISRPVSKPTSPKPEKTAPQPAFAETEMVYFVVDEIKYRIISQIFVFYFFITQH